MTNTLCKLTWNAPEYDGGSPVIGYYVERYIESSWSSVNSTPLPTCSVSLELFEAHCDNEFRVCAVNAVGVGPASETICVELPDIGLSVSLPVELHLLITVG